MATIKVHGTPRSMGVARVLTTLHEKVLDCKSVPVDMAAREHKSPAFLARNIWEKVLGVNIVDAAKAETYDQEQLASQIITRSKAGKKIGFIGLGAMGFGMFYPFLEPLGQVPAFEDGDLNLFESRAITQYIAHTYADKGTQLIFQDPKKMALLSVWMEVEGQHFEPASTALIVELVLHPFYGKPTDQAVVEANEAKLVKVLDVYEGRLGESKYLGGECFSLADVHHLPNIAYLMDTPMKKLFTTRPKVSAWCDDILARPSWSKVLEMRK